jgi:hypothetical protein
MKKIADMIFDHLITPEISSVHTKSMSYPYTRYTLLTLLLFQSL